MADGLGFCQNDRNAGRGPRELPESYQMRIEVLEGPGRVGERGDGASSRSRSRFEVEGDRLAVDLEGDTVGVASDPHAMPVLEERGRA